MFSLENKYKNVIQFTSKSNHSAPQSAVTYTLVQKFEIEFKRKSDFITSN